MRLLIDRWVWQMAWRESRGSRRRLILFLSSMIVGVALLTALTSIADSLRKTVDDEARTLLGADMRLESNRQFADSTEAFIDSLGGEQVRRTSFMSMVVFPKQMRTRMAMVRGTEPGFPFYGVLETDPPEAAARYLESQSALVDRGFMDNFGLSLGDSVQVGQQHYSIAGAILKAPRETAISMLIMPPVYVPLADLDTTLLRQGALAQYEIFFKFEPDTDLETLKESVLSRAREHRVRLSIPDDELEFWGTVLSLFTRFFGLAGFAALVLGGLGVGGAINAHVQRCLDNVALLRCLGTGSDRTLQVYFAQALALGVVAGTLGCVAGMLIQLLLPLALADFLPFSIRFNVSWYGMAMGFCIGLCVTLLFAILPLLDVRRVSPLRALRSIVEPLPPSRLRYVIFLVVLTGLVAVAYTQSGSIWVSFSYAFALVFVFGIVALQAQGLIMVARLAAVRARPYPLRQALANLHRPGNQTLLMMVALGLGTFLVTVLLIGEHITIGRIDALGGEGLPNAIMFDIQRDQLDGIKEVLEENDEPIFEMPALVSMRIHSRNGKTVAEMEADTSEHVTWAYRREYRSTYRDRLTSAEEVVEGEFEGEYEGEGPVPISVDADFARNELRVGIGDTLVFNVQGSLVTTRVSSLREIKWDQMRSNFYVVFPTGVLEQAPQTYIITTRQGNPENTDKLQAAIVAKYPNVTVVSLGAILEVVNQIVDRIAFAIRFMAYFCLMAGLLVLAASVMISRLQRINENALLKTLGASRRQVIAINVIEYVILGLLSSATGLILSLGAAWPLAKFVFRQSYVIDLWQVLAVVAAVTVITVGVGLLSSRRMYARPTLEVLRANTQ